MFGWNWDFEIIKFDLNMDAKQAIVIGKLTCRSGSNSVIKMQFGRADIKFKKDTQIPLDLGNDLKAASTDCLKKCASELGIASDIYGKNEFKAIKIVESKPTFEQLELLDSLIDNARLNDQEIRRIRFTLPTDSMNEVSIKIEGLKQLLDERTPLSEHNRHLDSIESEIQKGK